MENFVKIKKILTPSILVASIAACLLLLVSGIFGFTRINNIADGDMVYYTLTYIIKIVAGLVGGYFSIMGLFLTQKNNDEDDVFNRILNPFIVIGVAYLVLYIIRGMFILKTEGDHINLYILMVMMSFIIAVTGVVGSAMLFLGTYFDLDSQKSKKIIVSAVGLGALFITFLFRVIFLYPDIFDMISSIAFATAMVASGCYLFFLAKKK